MRRQRVIRRFLPGLFMRVLLRWDFLQWKRNAQARLAARMMLVCQVSLALL
jgi:hypothetical protein